ncbi:DUF3040 domain-containing protein [Streptomyces sp. CBMA123]|uniref:DUF3040 domain-containing protein n=1 Tax=Streptomyces sp. CBMA123 TaxID=1896313 RepID=UPI001661D161|nr:DUF3040 domain-containing protein [Streptomyces sp. CBMA123]
MDGPALSGWERRLLEEIESDLRQDTRLDRKLSTMGAGRPNRVLAALRSAGRRISAGVVLTVLVMTAICAGIGVRTPATAVLIALGVVWAASVAAAVAATALLRRRRGPGRGYTVDQDRPDRRERGEGGEGREGRERRPWDRPEA